MRGCPTAGSGRRAVARGRADVEGGAPGQSFGRVTQISRYEVYFRVHVAVGSGEGHCSLCLSGNLDEFLLSVIIYHAIMVKLVKLINSNAALQSIILVFLGCFRMHYRLNL